MTDLAGEITSAEAWKLLNANSAAVLVDVRTTAEWSYVGVCDLSTPGNQLIHSSWQIFPDMTVNPRFCDELEQAGVSTDTPLLFLCRSGVRSKAAAIAMAQRGYNNCFNITDGFEGDPDPHRHRGTVNGWKASGLPWVQQ
ncbi:MAG: rhodanese-like domain-containing protein [Sphingomonadales bacterium]